MDNSPLKRLPAELHNRIYGLVFSDRQHRLPLDHLSKYSGLTQTCREICIETRALFFAAYKFHYVFTNEVAEFPQPCLLLRSLGPGILSQIPELVVDSGGTHNWIAINGTGSKHAIDSGKVALERPYTEHWQMVYDTLIEIGLEIKQYCRFSEGWMISMSKEME